MILFLGRLLKTVLDKSGAGAAHGVDRREYGLVDTQAKEPEMPLVYVCPHCSKEVNDKTEKYVEIIRAHESTTRKIAHATCHATEMKKLANQR